MKRIVGCALLLMPWAVIGILKYVALPQPYAVAVMFFGGIVGGVALTIGLILVRKPRGPRDVNRAA